jgi:hypothetical protein
MYSNSKAKLVKGPNIIQREQLGHYNYNILSRFAGIIHIPYEMSTMSIAEHYSSGVPLFFPTKIFLYDLWGTKKVEWWSNYWKLFNKNTPPEYLQETENPDYWIERADFYDYVGVYYFDSIQQLQAMLQNFKDTKFEERMNYIRTRKDQTLQNWSTIFV